jgi:hypothetical protein
MTKIVTFSHGRPSQRLVFASCSLMTAQGEAETGLGSRFSASMGQTATHPS